MKLNKFLFAFAIMVFVGISVQAQGLKVPKLDMSTQILGILNDTKGLDLSSDQKGKLETNNKSFVDELMKINNGSASDEDKKASFLGLKNNRIKFLTGLMGNDLFQKYSGQILKSINPLKSKLGLAALAF